MFVHTHNKYELFFETCEGLFQNFKSGNLIDVDTKRERQPKGFEGDVM